jgi:hypothetical protein
MQPQGLHCLRKQLSILLSGVAVLVAALSWTGQDGRMLTYAALVLACAASQAWLTRAR